MVAAISFYRETVASTRFFSCNFFQLEHAPVGEFKWDIFPRKVNWNPENLLVMIRFLLLQRFSRMNGLPEMDDEKLR